MLDARALCGSWASVYDRIRIYTSLVCAVTYFVYLKVETTPS